MTLNPSPLGQYLRSKRLQAGFSLRELAAQLGISHVTLGQVERGARSSLARHHWEPLVALLPDATLDDLERLHDATKPLQFTLQAVGPEYHSVAVALRRRAENDSLSKSQIDRILAILNTDRRGAK